MFAARFAARRIIRSSLELKLRQKWKYEVICMPAGAKITERSSETWKE